MITLERGGKQGLDVTVTVENESVASMFFLAVALWEEVMKHARAGVSRFKNFESESEESQQKMLDNALTGFVGAVYNKSGFSIANENKKDQNTKIEEIVKRILEDTNKD